MGRGGPAPRGLLSGGAPAPGFPSDYVSREGCRIPESPFEYLSRADSRPPHPPRHQRVRLSWAVYAPAIQAAILGSSSGNSIFPCQLRLTWVGHTWTVRGEALVGGGVAVVNDPPANARPQRRRCRKAAARRRCRKAAAVPKEFQKPAVVTKMGTVGRLRLRRVEARARRARQQRRHRPFEPSGCPVGIRMMPLNVPSMVGSFQVFRERRLRER